MKINKFIVLLVAVSLCILLLVKVLYGYDAILRYSKDIPYIERSIETQVDIMRDYLERRVNRVAQTQDEYQYSTNKKIERLEERIKQLESK